MSVLTNRFHLAIAIYVRCYGEGCLLEKDKYPQNVQTICFAWQLVSRSRTENRPGPCKRGHLRMRLNKCPRCLGSAVKPRGHCRAPCEPADRLRATVFFRSSKPKVVFSRVHGDESLIRVLTPCNHVVHICSVLHITCRMKCNLFEPKKNSVVPRSHAARCPLSGLPDHWQPSTITERLHSPLSSVWWGFLNGPFLLFIVISLWRIQRGWIGRASGMYYFVSSVISFFSLPFDTAFLCGCPDLRHYSGGGSSRTLAPFKVPPESISLGSVSSLTSEKMKGTFPSPSRRFLCCRIFFCFLIGSFFLSRRNVYSSLFASCLRTSLNSGSENRVVAPYQRRKKKKSLLHLRFVCSQPASTRLAYMRRPEGRLHV